MSDTALEMMQHYSNLQAGGPDVAQHQPAMTPDFSFGMQLEGTKDKLADKKILFIGAGDVWPKFVLWAVEHLGVKRENITVLERDPLDPRLTWQFNGIKRITQAELAKDSSLVKGEDFDFATVLTPPGQHLANIEQAFKLGLPVMVEKPAFVTPEHYKEFEVLQEKHKIPVYFMDWEVPLASSLYAALGHALPFSDSITFENKDAFASFDMNNIADIQVRFVEGRGNPLANADHRDWLKKGRNGILADMGAHAIAALAVMGFTLDKVTAAKFGKRFPGGKWGEFEQIGLEPGVAVAEQTGEWYARVQADMSLGAQNGVPVTIEAAKAGYENDMRIDLIDKNGKLLRYEFGNQISKTTLHPSKDSTEVLACAQGKGDPYAFMFLHANQIFDDWHASGKAPEKAIAAYGKEFEETLKVVAAGHDVARAEIVPAGQYFEQLALETGAVKRQSDTHVTHKVETIAHSKIISGDDKYWTAEGPVFDETLRQFWWTDIENGTLVRYDPTTQERTSWKLTSDAVDIDGRPSQMIGGTTAVNQDGTIIVMLDGNGPNAGLNYFDPAKGELYNVGNIPGEEKNALTSRNRPNDSTMIDVDGKNLLLVGTMSKDWTHIRNPDGSLETLAGYYVVDPTTLESHRLSFEGDVFPGAVLTNGLADGGTTTEGKKILYWAETVETAGQKGRNLNVYRGELDPATYKVSAIEKFKTHKDLGGTLNGKNEFGRPDGANMAIYNGKPVYGVSVLETGTLRFFDVQTKEAVLDIKLPADKCTKFAFGKDAEGHNTGIVTTVDFAYKSRRTGQAADGLNGSVIEFKLPAGLEPMPQTMQRVSYPTLETLKAAGVDAPAKLTTTTPTKVEGVTVSTVDAPMHSANVIALSKSFARRIPLPLVDVAASHAAR